MSVLSCHAAGAGGWWPPELLMQSHSIHIHHNHKRHSTWKIPCGKRLWGAVGTSTSGCQLCAILHVAALHGLPPELSPILLALLLGLTFALCVYFCISVCLIYFSSIVFGGSGASVVNHKTLVARIATWSACYSFLLLLLLTLLITLFIKSNLWVWILKEDKKETFPWLLTYILDKDHLLNCYTPVNWYTSLDFAHIIHSFGNPHPNSWLNMIGGIPPEDL